MKNYFEYEHFRDIQKYPTCWKSENDWCSPHFHSSIELVYVEKGELTAILNGEALEVTAGELLIVPSYTMHTYQTEAYSVSYVYIIPLDTVPSLKSFLHKKTFPHYILNDAQILAEIIHCMKMAEMTTRESPGKYDQNIIKGYTYVILGIIIKYIGLIDIPENKIASKAQDILVYLQEHFLEPITLENVSSHFGYSKSRFSHIFNQYFGCKLIEYINGLRCYYALELMKENQHTVTEIALTSGFDSTRTFYRAFQKIFAKSPKKYIETMVPSN